MYYVLCLILCNDLTSCLVLHEHVLYLMCSKVILSDFDKSDALWLPIPNLNYYEEGFTQWIIANVLVTLSPLIVGAPRVCLFGCKSFSKVSLVSISKNTPSLVDLKSDSATLLAFFLGEYQAVLPWCSAFHSRIIANLELLLPIFPRK